MPNWPRNTSGPLPRSLCLYPSNQIRQGCYYAARVGDSPDTRSTFMCEAYNLVSIAFLMEAGRRND